MDSVSSFFSKYYYFIGLFLCIGFIVTDRYLMPEDLRMGKGEIRTFKEFFQLVKKKYDQYVGSKK